jgi:hypothetical protein
VNGRKHQFQFVDSSALRGDSLLRGLVRPQDRADQILSYLRGHVPQKPGCIVGLFIDGQAHAQAEFGVVFEQGIGPGRAASGRIGSVGCGRQVSAVDRGASGGVRDERAVAKQLREELDVGCFAAARARARKFEERFEQLNVLDLRVRQTAAIEIGDRQEKVPILALGLAKRRLILHVDGLMFRFALALRGASLHAEAAAGAIFGSDLERVAEGREIPPPRFSGFELLGRAGEFGRIINFRADDGVRANQHAFSALNAKLLVPNGNLLRDISFFPSGRAGRKRAVGRQRAHWE